MSRLKKGTGAMKKHAKLALTFNTLLLVLTGAVPAASGQSPYPQYPNQAPPALQQNAMPFPVQGQAPPFIQNQASFPQGMPANAFPQQGQPGSGPGQPQAMANRQPTSLANIQQWFQRYDQIRRQAQMSPQERQKADAHMSKGLSMFIPGEEKVAVQKLLGSLVNRYTVASNAMKQLPLYPETERLHWGYFQYFVTAGGLFADYLKVQANPLVSDARGNPLAGSLMPRKQELEMLDQSNKALDAQLRAQFGIPPYRY